MQLTSLEQQHTKTQETLREKENELEKLRTQLKMTQGSLEEEIKKLNGQVTELKEAGVKKVSTVFKLRKETSVVHLLINIVVSVSILIQVILNELSFVTVDNPSQSVYELVSLTVISRHKKKIS